jgi:hypothetical protein
MEQSRSPPTTGLGRQPPPEPSPEPPTAARAANRWGCCQRPMQQPNDPTANGQRGSTALQVRRPAGGMPRRARHGESKPLG